MKYDICNIPIRDVFEPKDGCPLCRLRDLLETRMIEYITGAAMMEPDIRIETNREGFCLPHYRQCMAQHKHLSVALTMQSRLAELDKTVFGNKDYAKQGAAARQSTTTCFVCREVDAKLDRMLENVCHEWLKEPEFRTLFDEQPALCLPHFGALSAAADRALKKKDRAAFGEAAKALCRRTLEGLQADVDRFCEMYDYRHRDAQTDWGTSKDAPERLVWFLTSKSL